MNEGDKALEGKTIKIPPTEIADFWKVAIEIPKGTTLDENWEMWIYKLLNKDGESMGEGDCRVKIPEDYGSLFPFTKELLRDFGGDGKFVVRLRNKLSKKLGLSCTLWTTPELEKNNGKPSTVQEEKPIIEKEDENMELTDYVKQQLSDKDTKITALETKVSEIQGLLTTEKMNLVTLNGNLVNERGTWSSDKLRFERDIDNLKAANTKLTDDHKSEIEKKDKEHKAELQEATSKLQKEISTLTEDWKKDKTKLEEKIETLLTENKNHILKIGALDVELTKATLALGSKKGESESGMVTMMMKMMDGQNAFKIEQLKSKDAKDASMLDFVSQLFMAQQEAAQLANVPTNPEMEGGTEEQPEEGGLFGNPTNLLQTGLQAFMPQLKKVLGNLGLNLVSQEEIENTAQTARQIGIQEGAEATKKAIEKNLRRQSQMEVLRNRPTRSRREAPRRPRMGLGGPEEGVIEEEVEQEIIQEETPATPKRKPAKKVRNEEPENTPVAKKSGRKLGWT